MQRIRYQAARVELALNDRSGSDSDLTAPKSDFRSTPRPDIADQAGHVSFVPKAEIVSGRGTSRRLSNSERAKRTCITLTQQLKLDPVPPADTDG
jgi:hypothetical protein